MVQAMTAPTPLYVAPRSPSTYHGRTVPLRLYFALTLRAQVRRARVYVRPPPGVCAAANGRESTRFDFDAGRNAGVG